MVDSWTLPVLRCLMTRPGWQILRGSPGVARNTYLAVVSCCHALVVGKQVLGSEVFSALITNRRSVKFIWTSSRLNMNYTVSHDFHISTVSHCRPQCRILCPQCRILCPQCRILDLSVAFYSTVSHFFSTVSHFLRHSVAFYSTVSHFMRHTRHNATLRILEWIGCVRSESTYRIFKLCGHTEDNHSVVYTG